MSQNAYKDLILTNHALQRMKERGISHEYAWDTYKFPDHYGKSSKGGVEHQKRFGIHTVTLVYKRNERNEAVVISLWMDPPLAGTADARKKEQWEKYKKAGFWGKIWITFKNQLS